MGFSLIFPLSMGSSLIYRMWAFSIIHNRPLGRADWALILGWHLRPERFNERASSLGLASGPASSFFSNPITFQESNIISRELTISNVLGVHPKSHNLTHRLEIERLMRRRSLKVYLKKYIL